MREIALTNSNQNRDGTSLWDGPPLSPGSVRIAVGLRERNGPMDIVIVGIDLGKNSCSLAGLDASGRVVLRRRMRRSSLERFVTGLGLCAVAMEACYGAHHLGRCLPLGDTRSA